MDSSDTMAQEYTVKAIATNGFRDCTELVSVTIPATVENTNGFSFWGCTSLRSVTFEEGGADEAKSMSLGGWAFYGASGLRELNLPSRTSSVHGGCLIGTRVERVVMASGNSAYSTRDGVLYNADQSEIVCVPPQFSGTEGAFAVPSTVKVLPSAVFDGNQGLTSLTIPPSVTAIGSGAFIHNKVREIWFYAEMETLSPEWWSTYDNLTEDDPVVIHCLESQYDKWSRYISQDSDARQAKRLQGI